MAKLLCLAVIKVSTKKIIEYSGKKVPSVNGHKNEQWPRWVLPTGKLTAKYVYILPPVSMFSLFFCEN